MLEQPRLGPLAERQLAAWQGIARDWATFQVLDVDTGAWIERCASCMGALYRITDDYGKPYAYTDEQRLALVTGHLRQAHMDLDPDRP